MSTPPWRIAALAPAHLPGLHAVQSACYGAAYIESTQVFTQRLASPANASWVVLQGGEVCAYLAACRSRRGHVTPLHGDFTATPAADALYVHDLAVRPAWAGQGLAAALLQQAWGQARAQGLAHSALVAVPGAQGFWQRHGYAPAPLADAAQAAHLRSYGEAAVYLTRAL